MGIHQMLLGEPGGQPQNQAGGANVNFGNDGLGGSFSGAPNNPTPVNWFTSAPIAGIGAAYWIKFTDTGLNNGSATVITNNGVIQSLATSRVAQPSGGIGGRNYSYIIYANAAGTISMASGTSIADNSI